MLWLVASALGLSVYLSVSLTFFLSFYLSIYRLQTLLLIPPGRYNSVVDGPTPRPPPTCLMYVPFFFIPIFTIPSRLILCPKRSKWDGELSSYQLNYINYDRHKRNLKKWFQTGQRQVHALDNSEKKKRKNKKMIKKKSMEEMLPPTPPPPGSPLKSWGCSSWWIFHSPSHPVGFVRCVISNPINTRWRMLESFV